MLRSFFSQGKDPLSRKQMMLGMAYQNIVRMTGKFDKGTGENGSHYLRPFDNPFKDLGLKCTNCIFFLEETGECKIVEGEIEEYALCKLWIIPE